MASKTITDEGSIKIFTFKEGLLSKVAHDLRLSLGRFEIELEEGSTTARFDPRSITVDGALKDGRIHSGALSAKDERDVIANIEKDVLQVRRYPEIVFRAKAELSADTIRLAGTLQLAGRTQPHSFELARREGRLVGRATLVPSRWGIKPFKALLGAIKIKDRVELSFDFPDVAE